MNTSHGSGPVALVRDCPAVLVPSGEHVTLARGEVMTVVQRLGATITVRTEWGLLARIGDDQLDALGLEPEEPPTSARPAVTAETFEVDTILDQLRGVFDPEIPVNVVDLGLVYHIDAHPHPQGGYRVEIAMSMTAPGCGMGDVLREDARMCVESLPEVAEVNVDLVWDPPWSIDRMSEAARLELGLL